MKSLAIFALMALATCTHPAPSAAPRASLPVGRQPEALILARVEVVSNPPEFIFTLNNAIGFKDVAALERFIADLPANSTLTWAPSDVSMGKEPLSTSEELRAFRDFCASHQVKLIIIPGG